MIRKNRPALVRGFVSHALRGSPLSVHWAHPDALSGNTSSGNGYLCIARQSMRGGFGCVYYSTDGGRNQ
jgi:hypothetical protein